MDANYWITLFTFLQNVDNAYEPENEQEAIPFGKNIEWETEDKNYRHSFYAAKITSHRSS